MADLKPHQIRSRLTGLDRDCDTKQADVCGLYVVPSENAIVVSLDEKTLNQARQPIRKEWAMAPRAPAGRESEYRRHSVPAHLAALQVHGGQIIGEVYGRNTRLEFVDFLERLEREIPYGKAVDAILDHLQVHMTPEVTTWLQKHPRWTFHFAPTHASRLNQIELVFSILTPGCSAAGSFISNADLRTQVLHPSSATPDRQAVRLDLPGKAAARMNPTNRPSNYAVKADKC